MIEAQISYLPPEQKQAPEKFLEMLSLPKFQKALSVAAGHTAKTGLETAFEVVTLKDSPFWIEKIEVGSTDRMEGSKTLQEIDGPLDYNFPAPEFFHFHFHPAEKELIIPSPSDLKAFRDRTVQPDYVGIGQVDRNGKISILVVIKPKYRLIGFDIQYYEENVDKVRDYKELQNLLSTIGLRSFLVKVNK